MTRHRVVAFSPVFLVLCLVIAPTAESRTRFQNSGDPQARNAAQQATPTKRRAPSTNKFFLNKNWAIQSSAIVKEPGDVLSKSSYRQSGKWYPAKVPSTVVGTLVDDNVYPDPFIGMNLRQIPGCSYPIGTNFSNIPMPDGSPFRSSWWYRTQFALPASYSGKQIWLHFEGINFRANVWLNGKQIGTAQQVAGTFCVFELNIRDVARLGAMNSLAVEVFPPQVDDLAWTWVDWSPSPPDKNMGIFRDVYITTSGPVTLRYPQVVTHFDLPSLETAHLTVNAELHNASDRELEGTLRGHIEKINFSQPVRLNPGETKQIAFSEADFPQLRLAHPRVWWPTNLGAQNLYNLQLEFVVDGRLSDQQSSRFGIREVSSEVDDQKHRSFTVNGRKVLIRGGGWASDMFLRFDPERVKSEIELTRNMNLNSIRLEGQLQPDYFFDLADQYGILIIAGWCCCSHWEHWEHREDYKDGPTWDKEDYDIAAKSQADQIKRLRSHPSMLAWLNGSDNPPPASVEKMYIDILKKYQWPNPYISSATAKETSVTGATGVKMEGPYEWVPPVYWLTDKEAGGAHGFATEISPGPAVPTIETLRRIIPESKLWPIEQVWNYHAGGGEFKDLKVFTEALNARYGAATDAADFAMKSQMMAYEGQRAMFEGYGANRFKSTGVIQWMLNNAWPSMIWHLYDYYLIPGGGYFGTKKACEPVHVQYSYGDRSVMIVNTTSQSLQNLKLSARLYDSKFKEIFSKTVEVDLQPDTNFKGPDIPEPTEVSGTYFLKLDLDDPSGKSVGTNFYWLSNKQDVLDRPNTKWYYTPVSSYADMTQLKELQPVALSVSSMSRPHGGMQTVEVSISNPGTSLAFFIRLRITQGRNGNDVTPILWQDNYVTLAPGERKKIAATFRAKDLNQTAPYISIDGWNIKPLVIGVGSPAK